MTRVPLTVSFIRESGATCCFRLKFSSSAAFTLPRQVPWACVYCRETPSGALSAFPDSSGGTANFEGRLFCACRGQGSSRGPERARCARPRAPPRSSHYVTSTASGGSPARAASCLQARPGARRGGDSVAGSGPAAEGPRRPLGDDWTRGRGEYQRGPAGVRQGCWGGGGAAIRALRKSHLAGWPERACSVRGEAQELA